MNPEHKNTLRKLSIKLRHLLEGYCDEKGDWNPGDLEKRLNALGIWKERNPKPIDELPHLAEEDLSARKVLDAYLQYQKESGVSLEESIAEFVRESAYTWANRLFALRCMESRGLIDEAILQKEAYGWRSLQHNRLASKRPELCASEDDGLFLMIFQEFDRMAQELPELFDPSTPAVVLRPSIACLKQCIALLSGKEPVNGQQFCSDIIFEAPDAFGWMYQYWNEEEKNHVFEKVRMAEAKIEGLDIIPATQLYTEPYMVKFLVQNSLGALWMCMHPKSTTVEKWEYYAKDADRTTVNQKSISEITFLDPACGSGHFLLEAFDLFYSFYKEEGILSTSEEICASILNNNLFGIDIDERAIQISITVLWMKVKEKAPGLSTKSLSDFHYHIIATNIRLPKNKTHLEDFLKKYPEDRQLSAALETVFEGLANANYLGSLLRIEEPVNRELQSIQKKLGSQTTLSGLRSDNDFAKWKHEVLKRLEENFTAEAEAATSAQAFFGNFAGKGLMLFDLLSRRYDVVSTNPPFMGSKNMSRIMKGYISRNYEIGKRDLYAAFILRSLDLVNMQGRVAMVSQQSLLFSKSFANLRSSQESDKKKIVNNQFKGILIGTTVETLVHLGSNAFVEISGEVVNVCLFTLSMILPNPDHKIICYRLTHIQNPHEKSEHLVDAISLSNSEIFFSINQKKLLSIPLSPITYWLEDEFLDLLLEEPLSSSFHIRQGIVTGENHRFIRFQHEINFQNHRWVSYVKAGGYSKWSGLRHYVLEYEYNAKRLDLFQESGGVNWPRPTYRDRYKEGGFTYSLMCGGSLSLRLLEGGEISDSSSPYIYPRKIVNSQYPYRIFALNSRVFSFLLRAITNDIKFRESYVGRVPQVSLLNSKKEKDLDLFESVVRMVISLKRELNSSKILERNFNPSSIMNNYSSFIEHQLELEASLISIEAVFEKIIFQNLDVSSRLKQKIIEETGSPAGWLPLIAGYDNASNMKYFEMPGEILDHIRKHETRTLSDKELDLLNDQLKSFFEAGSTNVILKNNLGEESTFSKKSRNPIPSETFLEELSNKLGFHPLSILMLIKKGLEYQGWSCRSEKRVFFENAFSVIVLRLLGHRWPEQLLKGDSVPNWADEDGIISITKGCQGKILSERIRERIPIEFPGCNAKSIEQDFEETLGTTLDKWLMDQFFKKHISQFMNRPVIWQIESHPIGSMKVGRELRDTYQSSSEPAFSCIVYYDRLDGDLLPKIRSQYVGAVRGRYETELRTLENIKTPSADQTERRITLENLIEELKVFDARLEHVIANGFDCKSLRKIVDEESLDRWISIDGKASSPPTRDLFYIQEKVYNPDLNDGVRVNIAPLQKAGLLASDVISKEDIESAINDRAEWRRDDRSWCRKGELPKPGWWKIWTESDE